MKTRKSTLTMLVLASLGLGSVVLSPALLTAAQAQNPPPPGGGPGGFGGPGGAPGGPGGFGGPGGGGGFAGGGRRGGGPRGAVTAVDAAAKTITITTQQGGSQTITVGDTAQVVAQTTATVADLKVGDQVQVQGMPTAMTAAALTIGQNPLFSRPGGPGAPPPGAPGAGVPGGGAPGGRGGPGGPGGQAGATQLTGTVTATSPLTISLSPTASLVLKLAADAKVTKYTPEDIATIKPGDQITVRGAADANGNYTATMVGVNMQQAGGFGGRGGGGGFGGGGQRGGPPGGPGGPAPNALPPAQIGGPVSNG